MLDPLASYYFGIPSVAGHVTSPLVSSTFQHQLEQQPAQQGTDILSRMIESAKQFSQNIELNTERLVGLGVTPENIKNLVELVRNSHMVPFTIIENFFPDVGPIAFLEIRELISAGRKMNVIGDVSMRPHQDTEDNFTTIAVEIGDVTYALYAQLGNEYNEKFLNPDNLEPFWVKAKRGDLIIIGPVGYCKGIKDSMTCNAPHGVWSPPVAKRHITL
jgi:hypothetical protein